MKLTSKTRHAIALMIALPAAALLSGCDSFIYFYEGDCDPDYRVNFVYDMNMKFADAFYNEVDYVALNVVDTAGQIVYTHVESGAALADRGYEVVLDDRIVPGTYRLQAWCGRGAMPDNGSFVIGEGTSISDKTCTLLADSSSRSSESASGTDLFRSIDHLYHGFTTELTFPESEGTYYYTVPLTKDTNSVKVVLQHLSGDYIDCNDFDFTITAANAEMAHDNSVIAAAPVTYHAWDVTNGSAVIDTEYHGPGTFSAAIAEFTIARLIKGENVRLEARRKEDSKLVFSVPLIDMALMVKGHANRPMDDQEYLDRQDDYNFVFFLDEGYRWVDSYIYINSWKVVLQESEL